MTVNATKVHLSHWGYTFKLNRTNVFFVLEYLCLRVKYIDLIEFKFSVFNEKKPCLSILKVLQMYEARINIKNKNLDLKNKIGQSFLAYHYISIRKI